MQSGSAGLPVVVQLRQWAVVGSPRRRLRLLQEAYSAALERKTKERETASIRLQREAEKLAALLDPKDLPIGCLSSLGDTRKLSLEE